MFQAQRALAADPSLFKQTGPILRRGPEVTRSHSLVALYSGVVPLIGSDCRAEGYLRHSADGLEVCFPGGVCIVASIHSGPGQVLGPRNLVIGCR